MAYRALRKMREVNKQNPLLVQFGEMVGPKEPVLQDAENHDLCSAVLHFLHESCEDLRFDAEITAREENSGVLEGISVKKGQIPYNMQMDIDRLCLERAVERFLKSGVTEDAFDVYFCYLEMFIGRDGKARKIIERLSEFETNASSRSVYEFLLGLAIYETSATYRAAYMKEYGITEERDAAHHFLKYWGSAALFHDIGSLFELPFQMEMHLLADMLRFCDELQCCDRTSSLDLSEIKLDIKACLQPADFIGKQSHRSTSSFMQLYNFAVALNAQYNDLGEDEEAMVNSFEQLSLEYKLSNILQAKEFGVHLESIGYFYTDKPVSYKIVNAFSDSDLVTLGVREHARWEAEKRNMCWLPAGEMSEAVKDKMLREQTRTHYDLDVRFIDLSREEQIKDMKPLNTMLQKLKEFDGLRIYRMNG